MSIEAPPTANRMPTSASNKPILPSGSLAPRPIVPRCSGEMPWPRKTVAPMIISANESVPPRPYPMIAFAWFMPMSFGRQRSSTPPEE